MVPWMYVLKINLKQWIPKIKMGFLDFQYMIECTIYGRVVPYHFNKPYYVSINLKLKSE